MVWESRKAASWRRKAGGHFGGYTDFRYGKPAKPVTLPQVFKGDGRKRAIHAVMDALADWRESVFEKEGEVRASVRSRLCLDGHGWAASDREAANLIGEAFKLSGAARPTWEEGQRWFVEPKENCRNCGMILMGTVRNGSKIMYCSTECANVAWKCAEIRKSADKTYGAIYRAVQRFKFAPIACKCCSRDFRPRYEDQSYCSLDCQKEARRTVPEVTCLQCNIQFRPKCLQPPAKFCSAECRWTHTRSQQFERKCELCGVDFVGTQGTRQAIYCCNAHGKAASQIRKKVEAAVVAGRAYKPTGPHKEYALRLIEGGKAPARPAYITPEIFDSWFQMAA
jgi:hypothetical protein